MKGFKPTGFGPSAGFKFPASFGFTGSTGAYTNVQPYVRAKPRAFKDGGYVRESMPDPGHATVQRSRPYTEEDRESGGKSPLRPGYKHGGKAQKLSRMPHPNPMMSPPNMPMPSAPMQGMKDGGKWIAGAIKHPGALHAALGVPAGEKIPAKKMAKAAKSSSPLMRKRVALAKTLGKMHKADGGPVISPMMGVAPLATLSRMRKKPPRPPVVMGMKGKFAAADGGTVYGSSSKGFGSDVRKTGEFVGQIPRMITDALKGTLRSTQEDVATDKRRRIDSIADGTNTASNYARGGKTKRMRYADGGAVDAQDKLRYWKGVYDHPDDTDYGAETKYTLRNSIGAVIDRHTQAQRQAIVKDQAQANADRVTSPNHRVNLKTTRDVTASRYAKGGMAKSDEAQDRKMIGAALKKHVSTPAPKGHKGLRAMCK